jgi:FtsP/CotA-like multicopper oxidase with cupredoxin domain
VCSSRIHIGTNQGLLSEPFEVKRCSLQAGERADVIIDFSESAREQIVLRNIFSATAF